MIELGKLKEVDIRKVWQHEQYGFSAWLAEEENMKELGDVLGLTLTDIETEKFVGNFRCDILCRDETSDKVVLIENQLEPTNHDHLGKIITYASGLGASVVVWIVQHAREEHASAIEWLNEHTDKNVDFFLIEVHAYKIGDSKPAPQFVVIEQPNNFAKTTKQASKNSETSETEAKRLEFWNKLNEVIEKKNKPFSVRKASTNHWYDVALGRSGCHISLDLLNARNKIRVGIWITNDKELYDNFLANKSDIEEQLQMPLEWDRKENANAASIYTYIDGLDFNNQENYPELMEKMIDTAVKMKKVFKKYM